MSARKKGRNNGYAFFKERKISDLSENLKRWRKSQDQRNNGAKKSTNEGGRVKLNGERGTELAGRV